MKCPYCAEQIQDDGKKCRRARKNKIINALSNVDVILAIGSVTYSYVRTWFSIPVIYVVNPAARGRIRRRENYIDHIKSSITKIKKEVS